MCKLAIIPGIKPSKQRSAMKLVKKLAPLMSKNDHDGFGYFALGAKGMYGERWLDNSDAFKSRPVLSKELNEKLAPLASVLQSDNVYNSFGTEAGLTCIALHARMATSEQGMVNTHPFVTPKGNAALVHNGVIHMPDVTEMPTSTCDSEVILTKYAARDVVNTPDNISKVSEELAGYFACAILAKDSAGRWMLDIFKDNRAHLESVYVPMLDTLVYCTDSTMVIRACKVLGWRVGPVFQVKPGYLIRYDARTGEVLSTSEFSLTPEVDYRPRYEASLYDDGPIDSKEIEARMERMYDAENDDDTALAVDEIMKNPFGYRQ